MLDYSILLNALKAYESTENAPLDEIASARAEITDCMQRDTARHIFKDDCYILSANNASDVMSSLFYDNYGLLYAASPDHTVDRDVFESAVRRDVTFHDLPAAWLEIGYDVISDLYADNEQCGCHNPDGTYKYKRD